MSERNDSPIVSPAASEAAPNHDAGDRRAAKRYPFAASAEVFDARSNLRVKGRCSDLSIGGCYVDTSSPLSVGAKVQIRIAHENREFEAAGVVAYAHVRMGMGLSFTALKREQQSVLRAWIAGLGGEPPTEDVAELPDAAAILPAGPPRDIPARTDDPNMRLVLYKLIMLMARNRLITDSESTELLRLLLR